MAYIMDIDLEFLRSEAISNEDLAGLVRILTHDLEDGKERTTETLTKKQAYQEHYPNGNHKAYIDAILEEFQLFGANTFANAMREGKGVYYREILCDVCDKLKVEYSKDMATQKIEELLSAKVAQESLDKIPKNELDDLIKDLGLKNRDYTAEMLTSLILTTPFAGYKIIEIIARVVLREIATKTGISFLSSRALGAYAGPIGVALTGIWTLYKLSGPAYRVTIPAVLQIIALRGKYRFEYNKSKEELENRQKSMQERATIIQDAINNNENLLDVLNKINQKLNLLFVGATGVGKSSTINALFDMDKAQISNHAKPVTQTIEQYSLDNLTIYDSPGLGDSTENDESHKNKIIALLKEKNEFGFPLIDFVVVIINFATRDLGTTNKTITLIRENLDKETRILFALNQCDRVGTNQWDYDNNKPKNEEFLENQKNDIKMRIEEETGFKDIDILYYAAGDKTTDTKPYNLGKLRHYILRNLPNLQQIEYSLHEQKHKENFEYNDNTANYSRTNIGNTQTGGVFDQIKEILLDKVGTFMKSLPLSSVIQEIISKILVPKNDSTTKEQK